jgi:hypothetical protein
MVDYLFLMHDDSSRRANATGDDPWGPYIEELKSSGCFQGGSAMGGGVCVNKTGAKVDVSGHLVGFIRVRAENLERAHELVVGNPVFEAGGTVEIRELPRT